MWLLNAVQQVDRKWAVYDRNQKLKVCETYFQVGIVGVENSQAFITLSVYVDRVNQAKGEQDAWNWDSGKP
jgi:hypothetical protein